MKVSSERERLWRRDDLGGSLGTLSLGSSEVSAERGDDALVDIHAIGAIMSVVDGSSEHSYSSSGSLLAQLLGSLMGSRGRATQLVTFGIAALLLAAMLPPMLIVYRLCRPTPRRRGRWQAVTQIAEEYAHPQLSSELDDHGQQQQFASAEDIARPGSRAGTPRCARGMGALAALPHADEMYGVPRATPGDSGVTRVHFDLNVAGACWRVTTTVELASAGIQSVEELRTYLARVGSEELGKPIHEEQLNLGFVHPDDRYEEEYDQELVLLATPATSLPLLWQSPELWVSAWR